MDWLGVMLTNPKHDGQPEVSGRQYLIAHASSVPIAFSTILKNLIWEST